MKNDVQNNMGAPMPEETIQPSTMVNDPVAQQEPVQPVQNFSETPAQMPELNNVAATPVAPINNGGSGLKGKLLSHGVGPIVAIGVVAVLVVAAVAYIMLTSSPTNVFKGAIGKAFKSAEKTLDVYDEYMKTFDFEEKAITVNFDVTTMDTNIKEITEATDELGFKIKDLTMGVSTGVDYKDEKVLVSGYVKGKKEKIDATMMMENGVAYIGTSLLKDVLKYEDETLDLDFSELKEELESLEVSFEMEDYKTVLNSVEKAINKSITSEFVEKESDELEIGGKDIKVKKNTFIVDEDSMQYMAETVAETLLDDDDFLKAAAAISGMKKSDIKDALKEVKKSAKDIETKEEYKINVYTKGLFNKVVGFSFEYEGDEYITYIENGKDFEVVYDDHLGDYGTKVVATVEDTKLTVKVNGEKVATGTVKELTEEKVDLTVKSAFEELPLEVSIYMDEKKVDVKVETEVEGVKFDVAVNVTGELKDSKYSGKYEVKVGIDGELDLDDLGTMEFDKGYASVSGSYSIAATDNLDGIKTKNAKDINEMSEDEATALLTEAQDKLTSITEKDAVFKALYAAIEEAYNASQDFTEDYYDDDYDYDYEYESLDMDIIWQDEVEELFASTDAQVLYVGDDSYETGSAGYTLLESLKAVQKTHKFDCHWLEYDLMWDDEITAFEGQVSGITHTCSTGTCDSYPAIYFIKDGAVKTALRGPVTVAEIQAALGTIGIS